MKRVAVAVLLLALLGVAACGEQGEDRTATKPESAPPSWVDVPAQPWAKVSQEQVDAAARHGVPVAFENPWGMQFVLVPEGSFQRGPRGKQHTVGVTQPFYMQVDRVRWPHFAKSGSILVMSLADEYAPNRDVFLTRAQVHDFAAALSKADGGRSYRLATEAEWEHAFRAGSTNPDAGADLTTFPDEETLRTHNAWGLTSMGWGGYPEWCRDVFGPHPVEDVVDPRGPPRRTVYAHGERYVLRSGSSRSASIVGSGGHFRLVSPLFEQTGAEGRYVLDRTATRMAQEAVADRWDVDSEAGRAHREMAEKTAAGKTDVEATLAADGSWSTRFTIDGETTSTRGTWALDGDDLKIEEIPPREVHEAFKFRYRNGTIELLDHLGAAYWVLRRAKMR